MVLLDDTPSGVERGFEDVVIDAVCGLVCVLRFACGGKEDDGGWIHARTFWRYRRGVFWA